MVDFSWVGPALQVVGAVGSAFGPGKGKADPSKSNQFRKIRNDAMAAGFNPVTALQATGGQYALDQRMPGLSSWEVLGQAGSALGRLFDAVDPVRKETEELQAEILRRQAEALSRDVAGLGAPIEARPMVAEPAPVSAPGLPTSRPASGVPGANGTPLEPPWPDLDREERLAHDPQDFPVQDAGGRIYMIARSAARRFNLQPYDTLYGEDYEALLGDVASEVVMPLLLPELVEPSVTERLGNVWPEPVEGRQTRRRGTRPAPQPVTPAPIEMPAGSSSRRNR